MSIDLRLFLGLITQDVMALLFRNPWMLLRTLLVDDEPWNEPQQAQRTYADKGDLPTEADKQHQDEYRSNDATNGGCRTEKALRKSTLLLWKPFCIALCRARPRSGLAQSEHHAESRERELTRRECSQSICQSPYQHATKESLTAAHLVIQSARNELTDTIGYHKEDGNDTQDIFSLHRRVRIIAINEPQVDGYSLLVGNYRGISFLLDGYTALLYKHFIAASREKAIALICFHSHIRAHVDGLQRRQFVIDIGHPHIVQGATIQIVDDGYHHDKPNDIPSQSFYLHVRIILRSQLSWG